MGCDIFNSVLLLDDEPLMLNYLVSSLRAEGFHSIFPARSAHLGRVRMIQNRISLLIADVDLPDCDARDFAIQFLEVHPEATVVLMTAFAAEELVLPRELIGRVKIVEKPFSAPEMLKWLVSEKGEDTFTLDPIRSRLIPLPQTPLLAAGF